MTARQELPSGTRLDGAYTLVALLAAGGFGITYDARDLRLAKRVAIKEYFPAALAHRNDTVTVQPYGGRHEELFLWGRRRFLEEAQVLARFRHPSIVGVNRVFSANNTAYMVLDFIEGPSFEAWLSSLQGPPTQAALDTVAGNLLEALEVVHDAGILHRDIAPDNILMQDGKTPVLIDFGAARTEIGAHGQTVAAIVKSGYSPKEQYAVDRDAQGPWTDIYALAATLYRAVTGRPPMDAPSRDLVGGMVSALEAGGMHFRGDFLAAIDAALAVTPQERPRSIAEWRAMLLGQDPHEVIAKSQPEVISALRSMPSGPARTARMRGRHVAAMAIGVATVLVGGTLAVRAVINGGEAERQRAKVELERVAAAEAAARQRLEDERRRLHAEREAERKADAERLQAEAQRIAAEAEARIREQEERRRTEEATRPKSETPSRGNIEAEVRSKIADEQHKIAQARYLVIAKEYARALPILQPLADAGHAEAMAMLGHFYLGGWSVVRDDAKARQLYEKAAAAGNAAAHVSLGFMQEFGRGAPRNLNKAREHYEKAVAAGELQAHNNLGHIHLNGRGVPRDADKARRHFELAAAGGNGAAMVGLARIYAEGLGVPRDRVKARDWLEKAANRGVGDAWVRLGWLEHAGTGGVRNFAKAKAFFEKALAERNTGSGGGGANGLGVLYRDGLGVPRDFAKARAYFTQAVAAGSREGWTNLGLMEMNGQGGPQNYTMARELFEKAAAAGGPGAMVFLAALHRDGLGVARDLGLARRWLEAAVAENDAMAFFEFARFLDRHGDPASGDAARAARLLLDAASRNYDAARQSLVGTLDNWTGTTIIEIKRELQRRGHYSGALDASWNDASRRAAEQVTK